MKPAPARLQPTTPTHGRLAHTLLLAPALTLALLGGCSLNKANPAKAVFALEARREGAAQPHSAAVLRVRPFTAASPFDDRNFFYRVGGLQFEEDFYSEFLVTPRLLVTDQTRRWLSQAQRFRAVLEAGSKADSTHSLEGNITALYADFREPTASKAVLEIRFLLLKDSLASPEIQHDRIYRQEIPLENRQPATLAIGWSKALAQILAALETDLATTLKP